MKERPGVLEGIEEKMVKTERIEMNVHFSKKEKGEPIIFIHGNFTSGTYFEETIVDLSEEFFGIAPDLRGYGLTEDKVIDATRGAKDWSDDLDSLLNALNLDKVHLVGWSVGGGVVMQYLIDHPEKVKTLTVIAPVSPFGFSGTKDEKGIPCYDDFAGSGAGGVNPEFVERIKNKDRSESSINSPRNVINKFYFKPPFRPEREEDYLTASLLEKIGPDRYPGDSVHSKNWPFYAPGKFGPINAISPKYFNTSRISDVNPKPPILWVRGSDDKIVSDNSFFDIGYLGKMGFVPNYPGENVFPPQPMITQTRFVFEKYKEKGGKYFEVVIKDTAHSPHIEKRKEFNKILVNFIKENA